MLDLNHSVYDKTVELGLSVRMKQAETRICVARFCCTAVCYWPQGKLLRRSERMDWMTGVWQAQRDGATRVVSLSLSLSGAYRSNHPWTCIFSSFTSSPLFVSSLLTPLPPPTHTLRTHSTRLLYPLHHPIACNSIDRNDRRRLDLSLPKPRDTTSEFLRVEKRPVTAYRTILNNDELWNGSPTLSIVTWRRIIRLLEFLVRNRAELCASLARHNWPLNDRSIFHLIQRLFLHYGKIRKAK